MAAFMPLMGLMGGGGGCTDLGFMKQGDCRSKSKVTQIYDSLVEHVSETISKTCVDQSSQASTAQSVTFELHNSDWACDGDMIIGNKLRGNFQLVNKIDNNTVVAIQNSIIEKLSQKATNDTKIKTELGAIVPQTDTEIESTTIMKEIIKNSLTVDVLLKLNSKVDNNQNIHIILRDSKFRGKLCRFENDIAIQVFATNIVNNAIQNMEKNERLVQLSQEAENKTEVEAKGVNTLVKDVMDGISSIFSTGVLALLGLGVLGVILAYVFFKYNPLGLSALGGLFGQQAVNGNTGSNMGYNGYGTPGYGSGGAYNYAAPPLYTVTPQRSEGNPLLQPISTGGSYGPAPTITSQDTYSSRLPPPSAFSSASTSAFRTTTPMLA